MQRVCSCKPSYRLRLHPVDHIDVAHAGLIISSNGVEEKLLRSHIRTYATFGVGAVGLHISKHLNSGTLLFGNP